MKTQIACILFFPLWFLATSCRNGDKLPKPTTSGKNTFGCQINGKGWTPKQGKGFGASNPITCGFIWQDFAHPNNNSLFISIWNSEDKTELELFAEGVRYGGVGRYWLSSTTGTIHEVTDASSYGCVIRGDGSDSQGYFTKDSLKGVLDITRLDTIYHIVSGRFTFTGIEHGTGFETKVTDGRFDLKLGQ